MDPVTVGALARIRQQEYIDEAARDHQSELVGVGRGISAVVRLVRASIGKAFVPANPTPEPAEQPNLVASR
jgi:hypothetical protein